MQKVVILGAGGFGREVLWVFRDANEEYKRHGFKSRKIFILTHADNKRAQAFYKKMGMKHETTLKSHYYKDKDEHVYSIFFE